LKRFANGFGCWLQDTEALLEGMLGVVFDEIEESALAAPHWSVDFHFVARASGKSVFEQGAVFKIDGDVNHFGQVFRVEIQLFEKRGHKFVGSKASNSSQ